MSTFTHTRKIKADYLINLAMELVSDDVQYRNLYKSKSYKKIQQCKNKYAKAIKHSFNYTDICTHEHIYEFSIPFTAMPNHLFELMRTVRWIQWDSKEPLANRDKFYCSKWHDDTNRNTIYEWYIDFDHFVELLSLDLDLQCHYKIAEVA